MARKPWTCLIGVHSYVREHPAGERLQGPGREVCRRCGKRRQDLLAIPSGGLGGGGGGVA